MKTLAEVRARFDELLAVRTDLPEQLDCSLCEDRATVMFYLHMPGDDTLCATLDLTAEEAQCFDHRAYVDALLALPRSKAVH